MQINLNQSNVNPSDLVAWVHKGYMYCPILTVGDQIFSHEIIDMSDPASKATLANLIIEGNNTMGIQSFVDNTKEQIALSEKNLKDNQYMIPDQGTGRSLPSDRPEDDIDTLNPLNLELDSLNKKS